MHNPEQEILQRFSLFSYWLPAVNGDDVIMPPTIVVFPRAKFFVECVILISVRNLLMLCIVISSHNYIAILISIDCLLNYLVIPGTCNAACGSTVS